MPHFHPILPLRRFLPRFCLGSAAFLLKFCHTRLFFPSLAFFLACSPRAAAKKEKTKVRDP